jgi:hypothetical protein
VNPHMVPIPSSVLEQVFRVLELDDIKEILKRTREIDEISFQQLAEIARKVGKGE